ncbi:MAG TPA: M48 family metalloprotease, partial [Caldimonas sp.]
MPRPSRALRAAAPTPWRRRAVAALCALSLAGPGALAPASAQNTLPALGDSDSAEFTLGTERKLGDEIMREIHADPDYVDDPLLLEYLQTVWDPLVAASRSLGNITTDIDQRFAWQPFLVRDPSVNAFALPGGFVGVHLGLIAITASRDELASVLAHEMSHVTQRHIARSISGDSKRSLVGLAALVLGMLAASRSSSPDAMTAVLAGTQAATIQGQLNFSREVEREADRVGFQVMIAAGFAPGGMAAMFEKMDASSRLNDFGGFPYLRTHPLTVERIGEARARAGIATAAPRVSVLEHTVAQARARVLMDPRVDALRRWEERDADKDGSAADQLRAACESAMAASLLRDWARADASFAAALGIVRG